MKIYLELGVSQNNRPETVEPQDMGYTVEEWVKLSDKEKREQLQKYADDLPEQPYWCVDEYSEED